MGQVNCHIRETLTGPVNWITVKTDILFGMHLKLTGTLDCFGIFEPICEGDNVEWDGVVFHIESVSHTCGIIDGKKHFMTNLALSNGIKLDTSDGSSMFVGTGRGSLDLTGYNPGIVFENRAIKPGKEQERSGDFNAPGDTNGEVMS
jgi:hypothetical protein